MLDRTRVRVGMDVVGNDADRVGQVKDVRDTDFLVDRSMQRDVYVPYSAIRDVDGNTIVLNVTAAQVGNMGWDNPPMTGSPPGATR